MLSTTEYATENKFSYLPVTDYRACTNSPLDNQEGDLIIGNNSISSSVTNSRHLPIAFFVEIRISNRPLIALIDSGASRSFIGPQGLVQLEQLGVEFMTVPPRRVIVANGDEQIMDRAIKASIRLEGRSLTADLYLMLSLTQPCILGLDFLRDAGIVVDFAVNTWCYRDLPENKYRFLPEIGLSCAFQCHGIQELNTDQRQELEKFLKEHLLPEPTTLPATKYTVHEIDVGDSKPICQKAYHVTPIIREDMWKEVDRLLREKIIEPSQNEWASPVVMVKKSNGKWRFCIDFRKVNGVSKKDAYPLPNMLGILDQLRQAHYISTIDLSQAYFQIPLAENAKPITAFIVPGRGLFQFTRMPFGLSNAPATLQRYIEKVLGPELYPHVFVYPDDIIIMAETFTEHLKWLAIVLRKLQAAGLTINREKSEFGCSEVKYLGFIVNKSGLQVDPEKTASVTQFPVPRNLKQIRRFLGMASWYRRFIPEFSTVAQPLSILTKKKQSWIWGEAQQAAFETLKTRLTTAPTLSCPDFSLPFI